MSEAIKPLPAPERQINLTEEETNLLHTLTGGELPDGVSPVVLFIGEGHSGFGLYLSYEEYPDEGSTFIAAMERKAA